MSNQLFQIRYSQIDEVTFPDATEMQKYLESESAIWASFLEYIGNHGQLSKIPTNYGALSVAALVGALDTLKSRLNDVGQFNQTTQSHRNEVAPPPPSTSLEGQLILGLAEIRKMEDAACVYLNFTAKNLSVNVDTNQILGNMSARGATFLVAAYAASAVPFGRTSAQKLAGATRAAVSAVDSLHREVARASDINLDHANALAEMRDAAALRFRRIQSLLLRRERYRRLRFKAWKTVVDEEVDSRFKAGEKKLRAVEVVNKRIQQDRDAEFSRLLELFHVQLRTRAPVQLWEKRAEGHKTKSEVAFRLFGLSIAAATAFGILVPYLFGDYIAGSFFTQLCIGNDPVTCTREFSAKGPLTVAGLLVVMSLIMWAIRLQYRVFLSERHLALDASEKQAFAETYLAIQEGAKVSEGSEAIVLASLFRPTQDGIIRDDESAIDLSVASILAKHLGRPGPQ